MGTGVGTGVREGPPWGDAPSVAGARKGGLPLRWTVPYRVRGPSAFRLRLPGHKCVSLWADTVRSPSQQGCAKSAKGLGQPWGGSSKAVDPTVSAGARAGRKSWHC